MAAMTSNIRALQRPTVIAPREPRRTNTIVDVRHDLRRDLGSFLLGGSTTYRYQRLKDGLWHPTGIFGHGEGRTWESLLQPEPRTRTVTATIIREQPAATPAAA